MGKSFEFKECERFLKRVLKDKGMYSKGAVIAFLITGGIGIVAPPAQAWVNSNPNTGATTDWDGIGKATIYVPGQGNILRRDYLNSVILAAVQNNGVKSETNYEATSSVIIGTDSYAHGTTGSADYKPSGYNPNKFTVIGNNAHVAGGQGTVVGSNTFAFDQGTAIGNDVYALGASSVAIGNDDITTKYKDSLSPDTIKSLYGSNEGTGTGLFKKVKFIKSNGSEDSHGEQSLTSWNDFYRSYLASDANRQYSPTLSAGIGSIAIGSRSVAAKDGSTAIGTLSYALGEGSTAMGLRAYTATDATGSVAIGEESRSFAAQSLAVGNKNESSAIGAMSYGYNAKAIGKGSLAFGYNTYANAAINNNIAASGGNAVTNPLRASVRAQLETYTEDQLTALGEYQAKVQEYYEKVADTSSTAAQVAAAKTAMNTAKAKVAKFKVSDSKDLELVKGGDAANTAIGKVVDGVRKYTNDNKPLTIDQNKDVYLTIANAGTNTTTNVTKSKSSGDNAIAIGYYTAASGNTSIAVGSSSVVDATSGIGIGSLSYVGDKAVNSIALGVGAQVRKENSLSLGTQAAVYGSGAVGIGSGVRLLGDDSVGIGYGTIVRSRWSVGLGRKSSIGYGAMNATALGTDTKIGENAGNSVALGNSAEISDEALNSMALGFNSSVGSKAVNSIAIGTNATIGDTIASAVALGEGSRVTKNYSTAIGRLAEADAANSVALGYRSTTFYYGNPNTREASTSTATSATNKPGLEIDPYLPESASEGIKKKLKALNLGAAGYISVGGWDASVDENGKALNNNAQLRGLRRIVNVAPGALDTDAVTVAQLREWTDKSAHFLSLAGAENKSATDFKKEIAPDGVTEVSSNFDNDGASGEHALALGVYAKGQGAGSVSIGRSSFGQGTNSTTLGSYGWGRGTEATSIGYRAYSYGEQSVALGTRTVTDSDYGVAIGNRARSWSEGSNGHSGIAIGSKATANYWNALALGTESKVRGWHSTAIGANAQVGMPEVFNDDGVSMNVFKADGKSYNKANQVVYEKIGETNTEYTVKEYTPGTTTVVKTFTIQKPSTIHNALAFGHEASVTNDRVTDAKDSTRVNEFSSAGSIAIGASASVKGSQNSVALGLNSKVVRTDTETNSTAAFTGDTNNDPGNGVVSIGTIRNTSDGRGVTRRIVGVAGGQDDFDAVNVKQLKTAVKYYKTNTSDTANRAVNSIADVSANYNGEGATGTASVTLGSYTKASGNYSTAIGRDVITTGNTAVGIGTNVSAFGNSSVALGNNAIAGYTKTEDSKTVPVGALEGVAIGNSAAVESSYAIAIGGNAKVLRDTSDASKIKDSESSVAIGAGAQVTGAKYSVALGLNSRVNAADTATKTTAAFSGEINDDPGFGVVSVGQSGKYRRILNVAGGVNDNDAVNVKQLRAAAWGLQVESGTAAATDVTPDTTSHKIKLKAGNNVTLDNSNGVVTINASGGLNSITSDNTDVLGVSTTAGAVTLTPKVATTITGTGTEANKLVTSSVVNTAINSIPITSFKADAGGGTNVAGVFTPSSSKKQVNITGAGSDGTTNEKWSQGSARFYSENIGTHVNSDGRILVGLKDAISVNSVTTYKNTTNGDRTSNVGASLTTEGLVGNGTDALTISNGDYAKITVNKGTSSTDKGSINVNGSKLTGLADGNIAANSTDAVTGGQLYSKLAEKANASDLTAKANVSDLAAKLDKTAELHVRAGDYTVGNNGEVSLIQEDVDGTQNSNKGFKIKGLATKTDITNINTTLGGKADKSYVDTQIGTVSNLGYKVNGGTAKQVAVGTGLNFVQGDGTANTAASAKAGIEIVAGDDGKVTFGLNEATRSAIDNAASTAYVDTKFGNAANKDLDNLNDAGKNEVRDLAASAVKVAAGKNVTVTPATADHVTTYTVNAIDTTVAAGEGLEVTGGAEDTNKVRAYTVGLSADTKAKLAKVDNLANTVGTIGADGRDGKAGTGKAPEATDAAAGDKGLTGKDGLNGKDLTSKVNALRNGEAGSVVYTDENGNRVVKANDGKWYPANKVNADGTKAADATEVTTVQARLVNPNGTTTGGTTKLSNIADGEIAAGSHDAVTGGQLFSKLAEKADKSVVDNLITTVNTNTTDIAGLKTTVDKAITFKGDDNQGVERKLDTTLTVKGAANFTPSATNPVTDKGVNIRVEKDPTTNANGLVVKLADTLTDMKGISGNGTDDLVIKNGDKAVITVKPGKATDAKGTVDFGGSKLANIGEPGTNTDAANKAYVDTQVGNAANKDLGNLSDDGKNAVKDLAAGAVKVAAGKNVAVTPKTTDHVTTYTVDAIDTTVAAGEGLEVTGGAEDTNKVRAYTVGLSADTKAKLAKVDNLANTVGTIGADGRDGKAGTGKAPEATDAAAGDKGLTGKDGLNGKDLTSKVNALRNGEAGTVVYTDENGNRLAKANDGQYYPATNVDKDGNVLNNAQPATTVQARLVNPDGTTAGGTTKLSNIADGEIKAGSKDAINGGQLHTELAKKADVTALAGKVDKASELHVKADTYAVGDDGVVTVKQEDGTGAEATGKEFKISGLATKTDITTINTALSQKANAADPITFTGDDAQNVTRALGTTLTVKGAANFTPATDATAGVNIRVEKDPTTNANGLVVKLADTLTGMKGISGNGTNDLVIKNGDNAVITVKPGAAGTKGDVDFGGSKLTNVGAPGANTDAANKFYVDEAIKAVNKAAAGNANLGYKANAETAKQVAVTTGLTFKSGTGTINATGADATTTNAATTKTGIAISTEDGGIVNIGLDAATRKVIDNAAKLGDTATDGRDGKVGTGKAGTDADAVAGDKGLTGKDGLNGTDLTSKVNALRNGEAGTLVYTDEAGNRLAKANDGKYYPVAKVNADGIKADDAVAVTNPQARLVNPDGTTTTAAGTTGTKLSNIAAGTIAEGSTDAINGGQLHTALAGKANTSLDNLSTAGEEKVKDLAAGAVKVAAGKNVAVTPKTTDHVTTYTVDAIDTTVAAGEGLEVTGGAEDTNKVRAYTVGLSQATKETLAKVGDIAKAVGVKGVDGRDGKPGTGADAGMGKDGLTAEDGLNGKDLTTKVNALRNGEAGSVVYTDENGKRVVKAKDGKWYLADKVGADGTKAADAAEVTTVQARLVNPDGTTTTAEGATGTKFSNIANGTIADKSKDAVNGGQLYTAKQELATALGGNATVGTDGTLTQPTYSITKDDAAGGTDTVKNVGAAVEKLDARINTVKGMAAQPLTFTGDDKKDVTRALGTTLTVKGAANFTPSATNPVTDKGVNIRVEKDPTTDANGLVVKLADTLTGMKGISGTGNDDLVIKNGDTTITIGKGTPAQGTTAAVPGPVNFGGAKLTNVGEAKDNTDAVNKAYVDSKVGGVAELGYKADAETDTRKVAVSTGLTFKSGTGTIAPTNLAPTAESPTKTTDTVTTKKGIVISTEKDGVVNIGLDEATRKVIDQAAKIGDTSVDGRDGKPGTGTDAGIGKDGLTAEDGLNGKDLTSKVNALRNGEAGSVVYTDAEGNRVVKADDGKWYNAKAVDEKGKLKPADQLPQGVTRTEVTNPQARLVNPNGATTGGTTVFNNVASAIPAAATDASKPTFLDNLNTAAGDAKTQHAAVNISDLNSTAKDIVAKGLTFQGNDGQDIKKQLGEILHIVGEGTVATTTTTAANNIRTKKTDDGKLEIGLAKDLVGITSITNETDVTKPSTKVEIGKDGITVTNTQPVPAGAAAGTQPVVNTVTVGKDGVKVGDTVTLDKTGISGNGTDDLVIKNGDNAVITVKPSTGTDTKGTVDFGGTRITNIAEPKDGTDAANKSYVDGKIGNVAEIGYKANNEATTNKVAVGTGLHFKSGTGTIDAIGADATKTNAETTKTGIEITTEADGVVNIGLNEATRKVIDKAAKLGDTSVDGRDGKPGTGTNAGMGKDGLTGADGMNGKDLTSKVNALRNGEAGSVVYTDADGNRLVKADDGKFYKATDVDEHGKVKVPATGGTAPVGLTADKVIASLVSPDGTTAPKATDTAKKAMTKLSNIAEGAITSTSNDAVTGRQIHAERKALATALGGNAAVADDGTWTAPTYSITNDTNAATPDKVNNVGAAVEKLDARITTVKGLATKPLTFTGDDAKKVERALGTELTVKGGENFTPTTAATTTSGTITTATTPAGVNIRVEKDPTANANGLVVKLADTLTNMKGISGNGTDDLVIKNGETTITIGKGTPATGGAKAVPGTVDFGGSKLTNVGEATADGDVTNKKYVDEKVAGLNLGYKAETEEAKSVAVTTGLTFKAGTGTIASTDLAAGTTSTTAATDSVETKKGIKITTEKDGVVNIGLDESTRKVIDQAAKLGDTAVDGRDGKAANGKTGAAGNAGDHGLTGQDGLNGETVIEKVNALRNGEAGTVVYTDDKGNRLVKANDGNYYKATDVKADGTVKTAAEAGTKEDPKPVDTPQARLVNTDGTTTTATVFNNVASSIANVEVKDAQNKAVAKPSFLERLHTAATTESSKLGVVNVKDLYDTSKEIVDLGLDFYGNDEAEATGKVHRNLGTAVKIQGAGTFTRATGSTNNINVKRNTTADGFTVELAENLTGMKEIAGTGTEPLTIKNGDTTITVTPSKAAEGNKPAEASSVNFGGAMVTNVGDAKADTDATNKKYVDDKVNALRNGEVGPVVYTDDQGNHLVKAKDGNYYKATDVKPDGTVKTAAEAGTTEPPKAVAKPEARLVSPDGSTTGAVTKLSNIADGEITETSRDAVTGKQLHATNERVATIEKALDGKADKSTVEALSKKVESKADASTVTALAETVAKKADKTDLDKKADKSEVSALANKAMTFTGNKADETVERKLGETLHLEGKNNITVVKDAEKTDTLHVTMASDLTGITSITGLKDTTWDPTKVATEEEAKANPTSDAAVARSSVATKGQLKDVADHVAKGRVFTADTMKDGKPVEATVGLGDVLAIQGGATGTLTDKNIGVELKAAETKDGKIVTPATMTVKLAKDVKMADGTTSYDRYVPEYKKDDKGNVVFDKYGQPTILMEADGKTPKLQKDKEGNPYVLTNTVVDGKGTTYHNHNLDLTGKVQVDSQGKPVSALVTTVTAEGSKYELRHIGKDSLVQADAQGNPIVDVTTVVTSKGIQITPGEHFQKAPVSLSANGLDNGGNTISNVAPGVYESDAATVGQVRLATNTVTEKVNEAGAHAAALAAMNPLSYDPLKKSQVMAGVGKYKNSKALALGVAHYANEDTMFNVGVSVGGGQNMMNAGVTYRFGGEDSMIPERYKGGPISSVYILQDEVSALKAENAQVKADNEQVKADNARMKENYEKVMQDNEEMKAQIKMLMAHMGIK